MMKLARTGQRAPRSHLVPSEGSVSAGRLIGSALDGGVGFTWNDGVFFVHRTYGIDA